MRVTARQKADTRRRILDRAAKLFRTQGYESTTTRDIAVAAEIATGTLFNYFPTKEAIVQTLVEGVLVEGVLGRDEVERLEACDSLEEELFARVAGELRRLKPHRKYVAALLETALNPLVDARVDRGGDSPRARHLETVALAARRRGLGELSSFALQLYWTLYTGVLAFWSADKSPKQEDTLALLDESLAMFVGWLRAKTADSDST